jgi:phosphoenolpyruvate carboxykinase (ATP)
VPVQVQGVDGAILNPRETWADKTAYDMEARKLVAMFVKNFDAFKERVGADVMDASPQYAIAAE